MSPTNRTLHLVLLLSLACACGPPPVDPGDDGGVPPDAGGEAPAFLMGPVVTEIATTRLVVHFLADRPVSANAQWRMGESVGDVMGQGTAAEQELVLDGLRPGRTVEIGVAIRDAGGSAAASLTARTALLSDGPWNVLFDAAHGQEAGNADWIVDTSGRYPSPADPVDETDWSGAYSAFGVALVRSGRFDVEVLPDGGSLRYGTQDDQDLSRYDVLVIPEPNTPYAAGEADAVAGFVRAGGGLLIIGDHAGADRDHDGWDPPRVLNALLSADAYGIRLAADSVSGTARADAADPLADGPFGVVEALGVFAGASLVLDPAENPSARAVAGLSAARPVVAAAALGAGRVVAHGDSSGADDGTDSGGNANIYDAWGDPEQDNAAFFLNAVSWLAGEY